MEEETNNNNNATTVENAESSTNENKLGVYGKIAERMKDYEKNGAVIEKLNPKEPFMMRLDGHCFSGFANSFNKPFDLGLHEIMVLTTKDLLDEFNFATCGYTQSDEITLVFPSLYTAEELEKMQNGEPLPKEATTKSLPYSGRVLKTCTLAAGICSTKFNHHCKEMFRICKAYEAMVESKQVEEPKDPNEKIFIDLVNPETNQTEKVRVFWTKTNTKKYERVMKKLNGGIAYFDARVFNVPNASELVNNIMWRSNYDCVRNSRMNLARAYFSTKELHKLTARDAAAKLLSEKNVDWATYPAGFKYGTFVKREKQRKTGFNPQTQNTTEVERTVLAERSFGFNGLDSKWSEILLAKYWNDVNEELLTQTLK